MEARFILSCLLIAAACASGDAQTVYQANSTNFVIYAPDPGLAKKASQLAEQYRKELSLEWLGYEIDTWREKCPVLIKIGPYASGVTSFAFEQHGSKRGIPIGWEMEIEGPLDRLLDAVLPHEITHTIFATHFGQPLPRWADEGACTTVEHVSERQKNHRMLLSFLSGSPSKGIPFNKMFLMKQYPPDMLPLYAQGYSVARYLIGQKGRQHFVQYVERGMSLETSNFDTRSWDMATNEFYGFEDLSDLQINWLKWVRSGSPEQTPVAALAASAPAAESKLVDLERTYTIGVNETAPSNSSVEIAQKSTGPNRLNTWYSRQSRGKQPVPNSIDDTLLTETDPKSRPEFRPGSLRRFDSAGDAVSKLLQQPGTHSPATIWR